MVIFFQRTILLGLCGSSLMAIYLWLNHRENLDHRQVGMPDWVPFWPLMTFPYLLMLILPWLACYRIREARNFLRYLVTVSVSFLLIGFVWWLFPTEMPRPETPAGSQYEIHRRLVAIDNLVCIVPCGHVMGPIAVIYLLALENRLRLVWLLPLLGLGFVSIATTWQHRPVDILTGSVITTGAAYLSGILVRGKSQGPESS